MEETKRDKFVRLAENRTNKILDTLHLLGNLSNMGTYEYTKKDVYKMFKVIDEAVADAKKSFASQGNKKTSRFTLE